MSCYKCGKDIPGIECEDACTPASAPTGGMDLAKGESVFVLEFCLKPNPEVMASAKGRAEFHAAMLRFSQGIGKEFLASGLSGLCKQVQ